jgi:hypothetical protein
MHFRPDRNQIYRLSQVAMAMVVDLEINKQASYQNLSRRLIAFDGTEKNTTKKVPLDEMESRRTYLGAYYIVGS